MTLYIPGNNITATLHDFHMHMYLVMQNIDPTHSSGGTIVEIGKFPISVTLCNVSVRLSHHGDTHLPGNHYHKLGLSLLTLSIVFLLVRYSANDPFHISIFLDCEPLMVFMNNTP